MQDTISFGDDWVKPANTGPTAASTIPTGVFNIVLSVTSSVPEKVSLDEIDEREIDGFEPVLKPVGYVLQPEHLRPSVWEYEAGESNQKHKHETQEELYTPLHGKIRVEFEDETIGLEPGEFVSVPADTWRRLTATEDTTLLAIGAPNEAHDAVFENEE